ncbi:MAG: formylglycine-generating enzyme family protein [Anaerolineae bacterium]
MKKIYLISLVMLLVLATSCGGKATPAPGAAGEETPGGAAVATPTPIQIVPTPTPKPLPPTPTSIPTPTTAPAGAEAPTAPPVPEMMVEIPAGEFTMGNDGGDDDEKPAHTVTLEAFEIDVFEVTNADFARFVEETGYQTEAEKAGEMGWRAYAEGKDNYPVVKVTWNDADAYCRWAGKRLPTEVEWEKAARGEEGFIYPWGNEWDPAKVNAKESGFRGTVAVGSFAEGASPYGVFDMAGNVWEWMADWYQAYPDSTYQSEYFGEKFKVTRGGGWFQEANLVTTFNRSATDPSAANDDLGFRCAR